MRGSWRPNRTAIFWPTLLWPSTLCLSRSPGLLNRRSRSPALCWMMAFFTASYQQLLWSPNSIGVPEGPFGRVWLSLPHLVYNSVRSLTVWLLSWLSYIIVQRPLDHPLDLWNGMCDRHRAEITVMQFTGHSLPVHHSEVGPSPCPILLAELTCAISSHNCHWNVSLPSGASLWMTFLAWSKAKIQQLPPQGWRTQSAILFTHSWRENNWIHTFPKGISAMWNAISLVQDLNSCRRVHFLRR